MATHEHTTTKRNQFNGTLPLPARIADLIVRAGLRRKAENDRIERMKLGAHLLQDLGFTPQGYPLPQWTKKTVGGCAGEKSPA